MADTTNDYSWLIPLLTGGANLATARGDMNDATRAAGVADPWGSQRGQYQTQLNQYMGANAVNPAASTARTSGAWDQLQGLLQNPGSITSMPGYQYGLNQAMEGVNRGAAGNGMLNSGNRLMALQNRGEGYARDWYNQTVNDDFKNLTGGIAADQLGLGAQSQGFNQLAGLAGVNAGSPTAAAAALLQGRQNQSGAIGAGIGGIANGLFGTSGSGGSALQMIQRLISGGNDLTGGGGNTGATDDWILQQLFPNGQGGGDIFGTGGDWGSIFDGGWDSLLPSG